MQRTIFLIPVLTLGMAAEVAKADFNFGEPVNLGSPPNSANAEMMPCISSDGLEIYFWSNQPGGSGDWDIWVSRRASADDTWLPAANLGTAVNSAAIEAMPYISADGLQLFFSRGSASTGELMVARRSANTEPWGKAVNLGPVVNCPSRDDMPRLTSDGLELYFISDRPGGRGSSDIWMTKRPTITGNWGTPVNLSVLNSNVHDQWVNLSSDNLVLFFQSDRPGSEYGGLYMSRRLSRDDPWTNPVYLGLPMKDSVYTLLSGMSADGTMFYLSDHVNYTPKAGGFGSTDMWQLSVNPVVDFNGDGIVDSDDVCIMVDYWSEDYPPCDIGPAPWGDGIVNVEDLKVLAEHLFEEVDDPTLIAHWRLDEAQGITAYDSAAGFDGTLVGGPIWQPSGGQVAGGIQLDGIDDYVSTDPVFDPSKGPFSVAAWVSGGAPGQAVLSQIGRADWLLTDSVKGCLMTSLTGSGRGSSGPLRSETIINDGNWHRIALVWDGSYRHLYVDGAEAASDAVALSSLESAYGGFYFGTGKTRAAGTFFSGMIDDIRIYNRAVRP